MDSGKTICSHLNLLRPLRLIFFPFGSGSAGLGSITFLKRVAGVQAFMDSGTTF
jgi:hypothetical protein